MRGCVCKLSIRILSAFLYTHVAMHLRAEPFDGMRRAYVCLASKLYINVCFRFHIVHLRFERYSQSQAVSEHLVGSLGSTVVPFPTTFNTVLDNCSEISHAMGAPNRMLHICFTIRCHCIERTSMCPFFCIFC